MSLNGKTNEEKIWNYLSKKINNDYGVAGLIGNLDAESGLNPKNLQNTGNTKLGMTDNEYVEAVDNGSYTNFINDGLGFGIAQWTWHTRKAKLLQYAQSRGKSIGDLEVQLEFLYKELSESYTSVLNALKSAKSVKEASNVVLLKYECPYDQSVEVQNTRASYGQKYYDKYSKKGSVNMGVQTYKKGASIRLSKNFMSYEFDCNGNGCCSETLVDPLLVEYLQKIRDHFGKPVDITSPYRCPVHNKREGGATGSYHVKGQAADIVVRNVAPREVAKYAESIGIKGIGLYETAKDGYFVHIDTRTTKTFWYGQAQESRSTFGGISNNTVAETSTFSVGKTYRTQVSLAVRAGAGTNYPRKTYSQLTVNARKGANGAGYLKAGVAVTCLEVKKVGNDIWIRIPSGWCAAYYNGKYYIK